MTGIVARSSSLAGKRIVVTRAREAAEAFSKELTARGAEALVFPAIAIRTPTDPAPMIRAASTIDRYDWLVFTSVNGVDGFAAEMKRQGRNVHDALKIAVVGPATASAVAKLGWPVTLVAEEHRGEGLAAALTAALSETVPRPRVLVARAEIARDVVPDALSALGCAVDVVAVYETLPPSVGSMADLETRLEARAIDAVTFTSSSTVTHLCDALDSLRDTKNAAASLLANTVVATIGPPTSATARARGLRVDVEAATFTLEGLVAALEAYFVKHSSNGRGHAE